MLLLKINALFSMLNVKRVYFKTIYIIILLTFVRKKKILLSKYYHNNFRDYIHHSFEHGLYVLIMVKIKSYEET